MLMNPARPLAVALQHLALGEDEPSAVRAVVAESQGSLRVLEAAYGRALALLNELPDDERAGAVVALMNKALGQVAGRS